MFRAPLRNRWFADSLLEEAGFEPSVPRDTPKFSTPAHVTCLTPCTRTGRREREPTLRGCRPPPAEPMVRILFPPAESQLRTPFNPGAAYFCRRRASSAVDRWNAAAEEPMARRLFA